MSLTVSHYITGKSLHLPHLNHVGFILNQIKEQSSWNHATYLHPVPSISMALLFSLNHSQVHNIKNSHLQIYTSMYNYLLGIAIILTVNYLIQ